ncbi:uncharacterized protein LOC115265665 [Aedes albopictus]|uniref:BZIP domain-containing protein n=1 Tax=Aedes albopictus TaxID=7160 RepID=A0ABM1Y5C2_AEDAL|nr:uncharacterized protein LOC115265665 [Aedes albopictus]
MSGYDNGAAGSEAESEAQSEANVLRIKRRKITRKVLADELSKVKAELERTRLENEELSRMLVAKEQDEEEFCEARSSTMRECPAAANETLLTTMNAMSLSTLNIPECAPTAGESELTKRDYNHWKNVLTASMHLIQAVDESTKIYL